MKISILGCGWLGFPLALHFLKEKYQVKGSTTTLDKKTILKLNGIEPYLINLENENVEFGSFLETDILLINIPPGLRKWGIKKHLEELKKILTNIQKDAISKIIFISSTSVYTEQNRELTEEEAQPDHDLIFAENLIIEFCKKTKIPFLVLRCGGLMGYDRIPCKYYAGKKDLDISDTPVNYIHRDDVIGIIELLIIKNFQNEIVNVVAPLHPNRKEVIENCCESLGYDKPVYAINHSNDKYKIVSIEKLNSLIDYPFKYPDPLKFHYLKP